MTRWHELADTILAGQALGRDQAQSILEAPERELLSLLDAAYRVRRHYHGNKVHLHVLENAKLGGCPEDCGFCSQSSKFGSPGGEAPIKSVDELVAGARRAVGAGAKRYCMVTATRGPSQRDLDVVCEAAERIKAEHDVELCASLGLLNQAKADRLAAAGIDRFNHNLETSERHFGDMVSTHTFGDRVATLMAARTAGMELCCGGIVGLGETDDDVIELCFSLRDLQAESIPVNFLDPRPGTPLAERDRITPTKALRVLCMFRFANPSADIRVAGGREVNLRSLQAMALYPANSMFTSGYLTTDGNRPSADHDMIRDLGFEIEAGASDGASADRPRVVSLPVASGSGGRPSPTDTV